MLSAILRLPYGVAQAAGPATDIGSLIDSEGQFVALSFGDGDVQITQDDGVGDDNIDTLPSFDGTRVQLALSQNEMSPPAACGGVRTVTLSASGAFLPIEVRIETENHPLAFDTQGCVAAGLLHADDQSPTNIRFGAEPQTVIRDGYFFAITKTGEAPVMGFVKEYIAGSDLFEFEPYDEVPAGLDNTWSIKVYEDARRVPAHIAAAQASAVQDPILAKILKYVQLLKRGDAAVKADLAAELAEINADTGTGTGTYDNETDALEATADALVITTTAAAAAELASEDVQTSLAELTEDVSGLRFTAKALEETPASPVSLGSGDADAIADAVIAAVPDAVLGADYSAYSPGTVGGAIGATHTALEELTEDASGLRFTAKALEEGPASEVSISGLDESALADAVLEADPTAYGPGTVGGQIALIRRGTRAKAPVE